MIGFFMNPAAAMIILSTEVIVLVDEGSKQEMKR